MTDSGLRFWRIYSICIWASARTGIENRLKICRPKGIGGSTPLSPTIETIGKGSKNMNVVNAGAMYQVYGEEVQTFKNLPIQTYTIGFHPQRGCWLNKHIDLDTKEDFVYGSHSRRVEKIFNSFSVVDRNFGVILSGKKGIGKSLMARMIAEKGIENGLPVIIVDAPCPGISDFLSSIEQEVVIIFDEFGKNFCEKRRSGPASRSVKFI